MNRELKTERNPKITGAKRTFTNISAYNIFPYNTYTSTPGPKNSDKIQTKIALYSVAQAAIKQGINTLLRLNIPVRLPTRKPVLLLINAFKPIGAADKKSSSKPEINPDVEPMTDEFINDTYKTTSSTRSGTAGRKTRPDKTIA